MGRGLSSKEIAIELGLSPQTVDTYLKVAIGRLGAANRRDAARRFAALEESQKSGSQSRPVAEPGSEPQSADTTGGGGAFAKVLPPPIGGIVNTFGLADRSFAILRVSVVGATVVIGLALLVAGALDAFR